MKVVPEIPQIPSLGTPTSESLQKKGIDIEGNKKREKDDSPDGDIQNSVKKINTRRTETDIEKTRSEENEVEEAGKQSTCKKE